MMNDARAYELIAFAGSPYEALPIKYQYLLAIALDQTSMFELPGSVGDRRPLDAQHLGEQILGDRQRVIVGAVTHHEQPTGQPLLYFVCPVARCRHHDLFEKGMEMRIHQIPKR